MTSGVVEEHATSSEAIDRDTIILMTKIIETPMPSWSRLRKRVVASFWKCAVSTFEKRPSFIRQSAKLRTFLRPYLGRETEKIIPILVWTSVAGASAVTGAGPMVIRKKTAGVLA